MGFDNFERDYNDFDKAIDDLADAAVGIDENADPEEFLALAGSAVAAVDEWRNHMRHHVEMLSNIRDELRTIGGEVRDD